METEMTVEKTRTRETRRRQIKTRDIASAPDQACEVGLGVVAVVLLVAQSGEQVVVGEEVQEEGEVVCQMMTQHKHKHETGSNLDQVEEHPPIK